MSKQKRIGTAFETAVSKYLADAGIPNKRVALAGAADEGDLLSRDGSLVVECKGGHAAENASHNQIVAWLVEAEKERINSGARVGILARKTKGKGAASADLWAVHLDAENASRLIGVGVPEGIVFTLTLHGFTALYGHKASSAIDELKNVEAWLQFGIDQGWISAPYCDGHDGVVATVEEWNELEENGELPCIHVVRLIPDGVTWPDLLGGRQGYGDWAVPADSSATALDGD